jgi:hypothetical protein
MGCEVAGMMIKKAAPPLKSQSFPLKPQASPWGHRSPLGLSPSNLKPQTPHLLRQTNPLQTTGPTFFGIVDRGRNWLVD